jgi:hypothetical protein
MLRPIAAGQRPFHYLRGNRRLPRDDPSMPARNGRLPAFRPAITMKGFVMSALVPPPFLRRALLLDAVATGATAFLLVVGAGLLSDLLGLPTALLRYAGVLLVPFVALVVWAATRTTVSASVIWTIIISNALWVAGSIGLLIGDWVDLTALGYGFVIAQAVAVGLFAELQVLGLRNVRTASA